MTLTFFIQLAITMFGYFILAISYLGIGWFCSRFLRISFWPENRYFSFIWIGWAITLLFLQVLNLLFPINAYSSVPILVLGLISAIIFIKIEHRSGAIFPFSKIYLLFLTISVLCVAILSMHTPIAFDSGLYHFNSVRWLNESPIVLGLGNLHGRLAFNQSFFAYVGYLNLYPLFNHGHNLANSFLLLMLLAECLFILSKLITQKRHAAIFSTINLAAIFLLPIVIYLALYSQMSSPTPDIASSTLQILIFIFFIRAIDEKSSTPYTISQLLLILIISTTAITIKLSNLLYVFSICTILLFIKLKLLYVSPKQISLVVIKLMALPAFIIFVWGLRGMLLSGCPAFPSTMGCVNTHWSMPIESVKNEADWVYSWARLENETPDKVLNSWDWLMPWFRRNFWRNIWNILIVIYPLLFFIASLIMSFKLYVNHPLPCKIDKQWFLIPVPILVGLFFWFIMAPDIRFAHSLFWITPITGIIIFLKLLESSGKQNLSIILLLFITVNINIAFIIIGNPRLLTSISAEGNKPIPVVNLTIKTTLSGLEILSPIDGYQCWDSKIPCTPYFNPDLNFVDRIIFPEFSLYDSNQ